MAEHKRAIKGNNEKSEEKHRVREQDSQPLSDKFHSWEQGELSIGKTPFSPRIDKHAELLSLATSDEAVHNMVMRLQQTYGNHYVQHLLNLKVLQAKLTVNNPNDVYEHEADRVAKVVTKAIDTQPQRQTEPEEEEEEPIQTKAIEEIQRQPVEEKEEVQKAPKEKAEKPQGPPAKKEAEKPEREEDKKEKTKAEKKEES